MKETSKELMHQLAKLDGLMRRCFGRAGHGGAHNPHRGQGRVLSILKLQPQMSQKELSYLLDMRKQSLGELLAKLEAQGLIARTPSEDDRRVMMIRLTEAGQKAAEALDEDEGEGGDLFAALNEDEQKQLGQYLGRLIASLEEKAAAVEEARGAHCHQGPHDPHFAAGFDPRFAHGHGPHKGPHGGHPDMAYGPAGPGFGPGVPGFGGMGGGHNHGGGRGKGHGRGPGGCGCGRHGGVAGRENTPEGAEKDEE